jgi:hypothetical protein
MKKDTREYLAIAERAAEWVDRLPRATPEEQREFMSWVRQSPLHVREFILALACKKLLETHLPSIDLDANELVQRARESLESEEGDEDPSSERAQTNGSEDPESRKRTHRASGRKKAKRSPR